MPATVRRQATSRAVVLDPTARIRQLSEHGSSVEIDKAIPIKRYFRSGSEMERQARVYYTEGQLDRAFMLYNKFATLFIEKLPKHPEYSKAAPVEKTKIKKLLKQALPRAMELKEKLKVKYEKEKEDLERTIQLENEAQAEREKVKKEQPKEDQADEIANFFSGQGGVVTSIVPTDNRAQNKESTGDNVMATEPSPVQNEGQGETVEKDNKMGMEYPSQVEPVEWEQQQNEQTGQVGLDNSQAQIDQMDVTSTPADLTSTDPGLAQVLPVPAAMVGGTPTYYQAPSAPPLSMLPPQAPPPQFPPSNLPSQIQASPPAYNPAMMGGAVPAQPHPPTAVCACSNSSNDNNKG